MAYTLLKHFRVALCHGNGTRKQVLVIQQEERSRSVLSGCSAHKQAFCGCRSRAALSLHPVLGAGSLAVSQNQIAPGSEHPASRKSILSATQTSEQIKTPSYPKFRLAHQRSFFAPLSRELLVQITTSSLIYLLEFFYVYIFPHHCPCVCLDYYPDDSGPFCKQLFRQFVIPSVYSTSAPDKLVPVRLLQGRHSDACEDLTSFWHFPPVFYSLSCAVK